MLRTQEQPDGGGDAIVEPKEFGVNADDKELVEDFSMT